MLATLTEAIRDLGLPTVVGAIGGAAIAHYSARSRERELLVKQDERRAARETLAAVWAIKTRLLDASKDYGELHNQWQETVWAPANLVRSDELQRRVRAGLYVLGQGAMGTDDFVPYAVIRGAEDVQEWLEAWLRAEEPPPAHLPPMEEMSKLIRVGPGKISMSSLNDLLGNRS